jgi:uncharacterized protein involved in exopolysaccharide biosynthesis
MNVLTRLGGIAADPRQRRIAYALLAVLLLVLCVVPQPYVARAKVVPQDSRSIGLGSMTNALGGQFQGFAALLGGASTPVDLYLAVARGTEVADAVIGRLKLVGPGGYPSVEKARLALAKRVDIHDPAFAEALTRTYVQAMSARLSMLGEERVRRKQAVVQRRFQEAADRVVRAEAALGSFRRRNRLAEPEAELGSALSLRAGLEAQLQAKLVELSTLEQFQGPENPQLRAVRSEVGELRAQIARSARPDTGPAGPNVAGLSEVSGEYLNLYRDYRFAQALYEVYARSSEEVAVETLAAETASDVQVIEAPRLDVDRKFNIPAVALLALVIAAALFTEVYAPATGIDLRWRRVRP